jgi:RNA-directed DNA polymerase
VLGVPTIGDRIAQTVVAARIEAAVEPKFHPDSYGYRPRRSVLDAVGKCRERCWKYDRVIDLDVQKFFDTVPWDRIVAAVEASTALPWVVLYVKRWLAAPVQMPDGTLAARDRGTPQGGLCAAAHKPPYEQCRVMRSAGPLALVTAMLGIEHCA